MQAAFRLDMGKLTASMLYICRQLGGEWDKYSLLKILYFSEQLHLAKYGRPITGDKINALPYGPVNSCAFDMLKPANIDNSIFTLDDTIVTSVALPDMDELSDSDLECLDECINKYKSYSFGKLKDVSHDEAYNKTIEHYGKNAQIPYEYMASAAGASPEMIKYIQINSETSNSNLNAPADR